jgi:hypothetical protein
LDGDIPCADSDQDGICDVEDCAPNNPALPTIPGTSCNDNNSNTINDLFQSDGCTCMGTTPPCGMTVSLGSDLMICNGDNAAITALVNDDAVCPPANCNITTLVSYSGNCDDPTECLHPSGIAGCLINVTGICPTEGPTQSSCNNDIICIASMYNSWSVSMTAVSSFEFKQIEADFWYPTDGSNAGGQPNSSSCPNSFDAKVQFYLSGTLVSEKIVNIAENQIVTKTVGPNSSLMIAAGSTLKIVISGLAVSEDCDLFELAGLRVIGCCGSQVPMESNSYNWFGPGVSNVSAPTIVVDEAGTYCVTVTDCSGCTTTDCVTVSQPSVNLNAALVALNLPSSVNATNGVLVVNASGGTGPYSYLWSNGQSNATATNLSKGNYSVTVTDSNGCITSGSITLNARAVIGDWVWKDSNQNGIQDLNEAGLEGVAISINGIQSNGNVYTNTTTSGPNGFYEFDELDPGVYEIGFTAPNDLIGTQALAGNNTGKDSNANPTTGTTGSITLGYNDFIDHVDAGFHKDCSDYHPDFNIPTPICPTVTAIFDALPIGAGAGFSWYFFNGPTTSSTYIGSQMGKTVGMSFTSAGQKLVRLNVKFEGCEWNIDHVITVLASNDPACSSCSNVTNGGQIGSNQSGCAPFNPGNLTNISSPSGGNGTLEYRWAASITGLTPQGINDPNWTVITGADQIVYKPGTINQTTYYVRFSKRSGCDIWAGISNVVKVEVLGQDITANFEVLNDFICAGTSIDFAAFDIGNLASYDWYFFNGPSTSSTYMGSRDGQEISFTFTSPGVKLIRLSVVNSFGCSAIIDQTITVLDQTHPDCANNLVNNSFELYVRLNEADEVVLDWTAISEPSGASYMIEHSSNGVDFEIIGSANGNGVRTGNTMAYTYIDDMATFGVNYYRIRQITSNGNSRYSNVRDIIIKFTDGNKGIVFPNPATDLTSLMFGSPLVKTTEFEIVNSQGSTVKRFSMAAGMDRIDLIISQWQTGYYYIYTTENGYRQLVNKLLKVSN